MPSGKIEKGGSGKPGRKSKDRATEISNTFEWLITAFILAFVFRAFVMEAFRIPTGSMADTLRGAHFRLCCHQCGYKYEHGFVPGNYNLPEDRIPPGDVPLPPTRCPSCGYFQNGQNKTIVANGDRILVLKCIYQFFEPKRWDVIVFKNPTDPAINYIKRLIGLPGEKIQIIDGDIYINGQISRKPAKVQQELWMPVYDNDFQPVRPTVPAFNFNHQRWEQPFRAEERYSKWIIDPSAPTLFHLDCPTDEISTMSYNSSIGNDFRATYAYDEVRRYREQPYCSDLMVRFYVRSELNDGRIGIGLSKYETQYEAWFNLTGEMVIEKKDKDGSDVELTRKSIKPCQTGEPVLIQFANVDHQLIFQSGNETLTYDLGRDPESAGRIRDDVQPEVKIFGAGKMSLFHVAIFRDLHYTEALPVNGMKQGRASRDNPLELEEDQFFVLGDNSPNSEDGRWWDRQGLANKGLPLYRIGIVPRDYLVGKALFVYWPSGFRPFANFPFGIIPNIGQMRFIYGGSNKSN